MHSLTHLLLLVSIVLWCGVLIWLTTDPGPRRFRVRLSKQEIQTSQHRQQWAISELVGLAKAVGLSRAPSLGIANSGAHYSPLRHRIRVSRAYLSRLSESDLRLILAHEVGHATRRWQTFFYCYEMNEEVLADCVALE